MSKITTGQMFEQWELMNQKLEALDNKINGIIDGSTPANTQLTGSNVELLADITSVALLDSTYAFYGVGEGGVPRRPIDVSKYKSITIIITNRHDTPIRVDSSAGIRLMARKDIPFDPVNNPALYTLELGTPIPVNASLILNSQDEPLLASEYQGIDVALQRTTQPTSGQLNIRILGSVI